MPRNLVKKRRARIEIIPLVDVMFLLLCFFVYATMNMVASKGIEVDLTSIETADNLSNGPDTSMVSIARDGQLYLNQEQISEFHLISRLKSLSTKDVSVAIHADESVPHGRVMRLLDLVRKSGINSAAFSVDSE